MTQTVSTLYASLGLRLRHIFLQQLSKVEMGWQTEFTKLGHRAAFVLQQLLGQGPATIDRADQVLFRHFDIIEEHFAER